MLYVVLFSLYLFLAGFFIWKGAKNANHAEITILFLIAFLLKVLIGCLYGKFYSHQIPNADTWNYFYGGLKLNQEHWVSVFNVDSSKNYNILSTQSYFNYYRYLIIDMLSGACSLMTGGRYYCNVIIFNFITFLGLLKLYRFLININPHYKAAFFLVLFFFPPFVFWTSGFHRDGLCMTFLGIYLYAMQNLMKFTKPKYIMAVMISIAFMLFLRSFWGFSAIIVGILWFISTKMKRIKPLVVFSLGAIFLTGLFALSALAPPNLNFAKSLVDKQHAFLGLQGDSELLVTRLTLNLKVYFEAIFDGFNHLLLRPYPSEIGHSPLYFLTFLENLFVWILFVLAIYFRINRKSTIVLYKPENNVLLFLVIINYAIIGLTVPFLGAIVRYKAPFELLLILLLVQYFPQQFLRKLVPNRFRINI